MLLLVQFWSNYFQGKFCFGFSEVLSTELFIQAEVTEEASLCFIENAQILAIPRSWKYLLANQSINRELSIITFHVSVQTIQLNQAIFLQDNWWCHLPWIYKRKRSCQTGVWESCFKGTDCWSCQVRMMSGVAPTPSSCSKLWDL